MTTAQVVETSVTVTNSSFQNYTHTDDHTTRTTDTPGFKPFTILPKLCTTRAVSSHHGTCRSNRSLGHVPATFSCVCKCCDFVPATCPRYTSLLHVASVCTKQVFAAATGRCDMSRQHDPSCLPTFITNCYRHYRER